MDEVDRLMEQKMDADEDRYYGIDKGTDYPPEGFDAPPFHGYEASPDYRLGYWRGLQDLKDAIRSHREYIHNARNRWPSGVDGVQVTSGDIELWKAAGLE